MPLYEHVFLARQDVTAQQVEEMIAQYKGVIEAGQGSVPKQEYWGVKSLTYRIRKNRKAHMALLNIDAPAPAVAEMERQMRISEDVIRFLTVKVEALEEGPSAMMQKRDRDERRGDRRRDRDGEEGGDDNAPIADAIVNEEAI
jgi:small subunit ribosomal protein S6